MVLLNLPCQSPKILFLLIVCFFGSTAIAAETVNNAAAYAAIAHGDYQSARKIWEQLARNGDAEAQYNLGVMYANGDGVPKKPAKALKWFQVAATAGNAKAQYNLGVMYANGEGVTANTREAVKWLQMSASQGLSKAQESLALIHEESVADLGNVTAKQQHAKPAEKALKLKPQNPHHRINRAVKRRANRGSPHQRGQRN